MKREAFKKIHVSFIHFRLGEGRSLSTRNWNIDSQEELKAWRDNLFLDDTDVEHIAQKYNQNFEEIKRAKEYLFRNDDLLDAVNAKMRTDLLRKHSGNWQNQEKCI
jgi:hypothetical protein